MGKSYNQLRYLESTENIKVAIQKLKGRELNTTTAKSICTYLQQGRMFLVNAEDAPYEIRPLILYYAISAFAKAIICVQKMNSTSIPTSHGLKDISNPTSRLESLTARIEGNGLFQVFNDAIKDSEGIYYYHESTLHKHNTPTAPSSEIARQTITLKEVLSRIGDVVGMFEQTFSHKANAHVFDINMYDDHAFLRIDTKELYTDRNSLIAIIAELRRSFPALNDWHIESASLDWGKSVIKFTNEPYDLSIELTEAVLIHKAEDNSYSVNFGASKKLSNNKRPFSEILGIVGGGQRNEVPHFVTPYNGNYYAELSLRLIGMFMLSSLVRYRPQIWIHSLTHLATPERQLDDQMIALIEQFIDSTVNMFVDVSEVICGVKDGYTF